MAILVSKAVEEFDTIPKLGIIVEKVEVIIADPEPNIILVTINSTFYFCKLLYFLL